MTGSGQRRARFDLSWGLIDQVVASGSNFLFIVIAANALSPSGLGAVAFAFELYVLGTFAARGLAGDTLTSRFSGLSRSELQRPTATAATTSLLVGAGVGSLVAVFSLFTEAPLTNALLVCAVALPGLALQDYVRSALIVQGRVKATLVNDTIWAIAQLPALAIAVAVHPTATTVFAAWAITGCIAGMIGLFQLRCGVASPRAVPGWLRDTRELWPYYLADNLVYALASLLLVVVISATAGLTALAGFRVVMTVYSPLGLISRGMMSVAVAMLARLRDDPALVRRRATQISTILTPLALCWGLLVLLVPTAAGEALFGASWQEAEPVVFLACFVSASGLFGAGASIGLRALGAGRQILAGRLVVTLGGALVAGVGGSLDGMHGTFVALAAVFPAQVVVWWLFLRSAARASEGARRPGGATDAHER